MDGVSAASGFVTLLEVVVKIGRWAVDAYKAGKERDKLLKGLDSLKSTIERIHNRCRDAKPGDEWYEGILELVRTSGTLTQDGKYEPNPTHQSVTSLSKLYIILEKLSVELSPARGTKKYRQKFWYHFDKTKYERLLEEFARCRNEVSEILDDDHFKISKAIKEDSKHILSEVSEVRSRMTTADDFADIRSQMTAIKDSQKRQEEFSAKKKEEADKEAVQQWLSPLEFPERQDKIFEQAFGTGQWFLSSLEFLHWVKRQPWEGFGKTVLSSIVINHLQQTYSSQKCAVIFMYLDYKETSLQTCRNLLGSLLKQLLQLQNSSSSSKDVLDWYRKAERTKATPKEKEIHEFLKREINKYDRVYLVVDALDECPFWRKLLCEIGKIPSEKLSLMVTSRRIDGEERAQEMICDICNGQDIKLYFRCSTCGRDVCSSCAEKDNPCKAQSHNLTVPSDRVEMFLKTPPEDLRQYVEWQIGQEIGLSGSKLFDERRYTSTPDESPFARKIKKDPSLVTRIPDVVIDRADGRFLFAKLYWDSLKTKETLRHIQEALDEFPNDLDRFYEEALQRVKDRGERKSSALGMQTLSRVLCARRPLSLVELQHALAVKSGELVLDKYMDYDKEEILEACAGLIKIDADGNAVRFVHLTLQAYLDSVQEKWIPDAEREMAEVCLTYLNYDVFAEPCDNERFDERRREYPLIAYASQYWGEHARNAGPIPNIETAALKFVSDRHRVAAYVQAAWFTDNRGSSSWDCRRGIDGLHVCSWLGLERIIGDLVNKEMDVDTRETTFRQTPLMYACRAGHTETVRRLLDCDASVNAVSDRGRTALHEAVGEDNEEAVELLLQHDELDINAANIKDSNRTALMLASRHGLSRIVGSLLEETRIQVNQQDSNGYTALSLAVLKGHDRVVESLLRKPGIDVDTQDSTGRTALILAAERNHELILQLLLDHGADTKLRDYQKGGTALHRAVDFQCTSAIELMIKWNVDLKCLDDDGRGLLHSASTNGWADIVRLLIKNGLKPNYQDKNGLTPLHDASCAGKDNVTRVLLELGADPSIKDNFGETNGDRLRSIPEPEKLPGWSLAKLGLKDLVKQAVISGEKRLAEVEPVSNDNALHHALHGNHFDILKLLLDNHSLPPDDANIYYQRTPLHLAAMKGDLDAAQELIAHHAKLDLEDRWGKTPLIMSEMNQHYAVAIALIESGARIDREKIDVQELLFEAIHLGSVAAMQILSTNGANIVDRNPEGLTPRQVAEETDHSEIKEILKRSGTFGLAAKEEEEASDEPTKMEQSMPVMSPETEHRSAPFRSRPLAI